MRGEDMSNTAGPMVRARRIVEDHIAAHGMVPHPDRLKEAIATDLGFVQLASVPHRDERAELIAALKDANQLCRSAYHVAARDGQNTGWPAFTTRLRHALDEQHKVLLKVGAYEL